jgi:hypothetical protein
MKNPDPILKSDPAVEAANLGPETLRAETLSAEMLRAKICSYVHNYGPSYEHAQMSDS